MVHSLEKNAPKSNNICSAKRDNGKMARGDACSTASHDGAAAPAAWHGSVGGNSLRKGIRSSGTKVEGNRSKSSCSRLAPEAVMVPAVVSNMCTCLGRAHPQSPGRYPTMIQRLSFAKTLPSPPSFKLKFVLHGTGLGRARFGSASAALPRSPLSSSAG